MDAKELKEWREGAHMSLTEAAAALNISRRSLISYEGGAAISTAMGGKIRARMIELRGDAPAPVVGLKSGEALLAKMREKLPGAPHQTDAPVKIIGRHDKGKLQVGVDGMIYGNFVRVDEKTVATINRGGRGLRNLWSERFESASGHGSASIILWGCLPGEPDSACAPILGGKHYSPARYSADNVASPDATPSPKGGKAQRQGRKAA